MAHGKIGGEIEKEEVRKITDLLKELFEVDNTSKLTAQ